MKMNYVMTRQGQKEGKNHILRTHTKLAERNIIYVWIKSYQIAIKIL